MTIMKETHIQNRHYNNDNNANNNRHIYKTHITIMAIMTIMTETHIQNRHYKNGIYDNNDRMHLYNAH